MRVALNKLLPNDVKIFTVLPVSARFDSKTNTSHREYSYYLPTYMLTHVSQMNLESPPKVEAQTDDGAKLVTQMSTGIKKILRRSDENDEIDDVEKFLDRDMSHISEAMLTKIYSTRLTQEQKDEL